MPEERKQVTSSQIIDVEKRKQPTKHYVFIMTVVWSDGKQQIICRRYSKFFTLQTSLIDAFPCESGVHDPNARTLPFLPGKILFKRSAVREVALKRKDLINEYLEKLLQLPETISGSDIISDFFEPTVEDINHLIGVGEKKAILEKTADSISDPVLLEQYVVISNFKKTERSQVSLAAGDTVEVIEKHENGWWFVSIEDEQGWAPCSYLEPVDGSPEEDIVVEEGKEDRLFCVRTFTATATDEITLELGDVVSVLKKCKDGWWKVR